ncbi:GldG family protein [Sorangium sp. So ce1153]|uniref:GldG family protein n=1 Tax=Sorangium sp. So ce1153 TaxID=3133333 RepID=UPI003F5E3C88
MAGEQPGPAPRSTEVGTPPSRVPPSTQVGTPPSRVPPGTPLGEKLSASVGIIAAMVLAVLVNLLVARHYRRWDWTQGGLYTLSDATVSTLRALEEPIRVYVLLSEGDPLTLSVRHLLDAYRAETSRIEVEVTDPDRRPAEFLAVQQRYGVVAGKTEDGRIVTDAAIIVARGDRPHFLTASDLVEVEDEDDLRARPRLEQALTGAIRSVVRSERPLVCFASGHGEKSVDVGGAGGLAALKDRLNKNNYEVVELGGGRGGHDLGDDDEEAGAAPKEPAPEVDLDRCRVLVLAEPSQPVPPRDVARYRAFVERGGSALIAVGPVPDESDQRYVDLGLSGLLAAAGVELRSDFVFELDPKLRSTQGFGETFSPIVKPHPITEALVKAADLGLGPVLTVASSLAPTKSGPVAPAPLLVTSDRAFGMVDFFGWARDPSEPKPRDGDHPGPLTVAYAAELPKPAGSSAAHGPRVVVVSSPGVLYGANWQSPELRGTAVFVESALSWLAASPPMLDIPDKPAVTAGLRLSEDSLSGIFRYVIVYMPLAAAFLGLAVHLSRRGSERRRGGPDDRRGPGAPAGRGSPRGSEREGAP